MTSYSGNTPFPNLVALRSGEATIMGRALYEHETDHRIDLTHGKASACKIQGKVLFFFYFTFAHKTFYHVSCLIRILDILIVLFPKPNMDQRIIKEKGK